MSANDPDGWRGMTCSFCGTTRPHEVYISILIATDDSESEYPYSQTDMCRQCWEEHGIDAAFEHNRNCREVA